jgi:uncharacterized protein
MQVIQIDDPSQFYGAVAPYLLAHEAQHNLIISVCNGLIQSPDRPISPTLAYVESEGDIQAVMVWTPPRSALFSLASEPAALDLLLTEFAPRLSGIGGPVTVIDQIRQSGSINPDELHLNLDLQIYEIRSGQLLRSPSVYGKLRVATERSRALIIDWLEAFDREIFGAIQEDPRSFVDGLIAGGGVYLWITDRPIPQAVSLVISRFSVPAAGRIGPVYTPPQFRRQGYGRAAVTAVTARMLARGCDRCFLFADRQSLITGELYRSIGYRLVGDWVDYRIG